MSDAVEVLREMKLSAENPENTCWLFNNDRDEAIDSALLWKEKLDRLEKWLDKKINDYEFDGTSLVARELKRVREVLK